MNKKASKLKKAFVTGITGQDGSWLADFLLKKGYEVHGLVRRSSSFNTGRIDHIYQDPHVHGVHLFLHYGDLTDSSGLFKLLSQVQPDEIYNLGAQSHVRVSFDQPEYTGDVTGVGTLKLLEAFRLSCPKARFYQASSSELYGGLDCPKKGYNEQSPFYPRSPYGVAKLYSFWSAKNYREAYGLHISNGILFNHESERRGETFVTRKITRALGRIKVGLQKELFLGNLDAQRDWGDAKEFVRAMWVMLQQKKADDYVVATGETYSVRQFLESAFGYAGLDFHKYVKFDPRYLRPSEVDYLKGDSSKARRVLGWKNETSFKALVKRMVDHDLEMAIREKKRDS
ncbi:MAG TPA: GDP-mannose 4,6-dehydratase [bacterium]|jgi:GDPmannose 4,6-dehydratase|nr:GDP-mannose 4,6-dehydratase [bacterium]